MRHVAHHAEHARQWCEELLLDGRLLFGNEQELTGRWHGIAARRLGLEGDVKQADWDALCDNQHPETGEQLTARLRADRTVGYDFNFHVPKSV